MIGGVCNEINGFIDNISSKYDDVKAVSYTHLRAHET